MNKIKNLLIISGALFLASCSKVLDQQPQASLSPETAFSTRTGVEAGLLGIYDGFQNADYYGLAIWIYADLYADNLTHTGTFPSCKWSLDQKRSNGYESTRTIVS